MKKRIVFALLMATVFSFAARAYNNVLVVRNVQLLSTSIVAVIENGDEPEEDERLRSRKHRPQSEKQR